MQRGTVRCVTDISYGIPLAASVHLCIEWDSQSMSLKQYIINLQLIIRVLDRRDLKISIIWPLFSNLTCAERLYLKRRLKRFRRWIAVKRLLIDILIPANPLPALDSENFILNGGSIDDVFGEEFYQTFNRNVPPIPGQELPTGPARIPGVNFPFPTVPKQQRLGKFISMHPA